MLDHIKKCWLHYGVVVIATVILSTSVYLGAKAMQSSDYLEVGIYVGSAVVWLWILTEAATCVVLDILLCKSKFR